MKILHTVEFYYPSIGGSQEAVRQLSERLVEAGHDVTVATSLLPERVSDRHHGVHIRSFNISGNAVRGYTGDTAAYQDFVRESDFDVIMNYAAQEWTADLVFQLLPELKARKIFVPCGFSGLHKPEYQQYFKDMPAVLKEYDATVYLAEKYRDIDFARAHKIKNVHLIPNGADEKEFLQTYAGNIRRELGVGADTKLILHVGGFTGVKGQAEAMDIFEQANLPEATLVLIGNAMDKPVVRALKRRAWQYSLRLANLREHRKMIIRHVDRPRTVAALQAADVFLFPSNIEASPLVLFEACAARTPFLTTDVGNAQEIIRWTQGGVILPTKKDTQGYSYAKIRESAQQLTALLADGARRDKMAAAGFAAWNRKYRWDKIAEEYMKLYRKPHHD